MVHTEHEMLDKYSGLKVGKTVNVMNVPIMLNGKEETIHTTRSGDDQKEDLVLLHGYLVGLASYFKMMKDLSQHYRVWCIDLIGMGLSSRPLFTCQSTEETIEYFVESIEQWRKKVGIERFHLAGQSFGGYMSTMYALKYPEHVKKLLLISPAGVTRPTTDESFRKTIDELPFLRRQVFKQVMKIWTKKKTPREVIGYLGPLKGYFLSRYVKRAKLGEGEQFQLGYRYIDCALKLPESTLKALHYILTIPKAAGILPLEDVMHSLKMPIEIYYGDIDWMCKEGAKRVIASGAVRGSIHIVPNAGHAMNFENPSYVANLLIEHKLKEEDEIVYEVISKKTMSLEATFESVIRPEGDLVSVEA